MRVTDMSGATIRTAQVKLKLTSEQRRIIDATNEVVHRRAKEHCEMLLAMRGADCRIRVGNQEVPFESAYFAQQQVKLLNKFTTFAASDLQTIYEEIITVENPRGYRSPLCLATSNTGKVTYTNKKTGLPNEMEPVIKLCRKLLDQKILPFHFKTKINTAYDYAAWEMATSHVRSWHELNERTMANYEEELSILDKLVPTDKLQTMYEEWKSKTECVVNEKLLEKVKRYGFDVYYAKEEMAQAAIYCNDLDVWKSLLQWDVQKQYVSRLRKSSCFTFPDIETSIRCISYGHNYVHFNLSYDGGSFYLKTKMLHDNDPSSKDMIEVNLKGFDTDYFRNLTVVKTKSSEWKFRYCRGNHSDLNEDVEAVLKEIKLYKKRGDYYLCLPLSLDCPKKDEASLLVSYCCKNNVDIAGSRTFSVDLNVNRILAMTVAVNYGNDKHDETWAGIEGGPTKAKKNKKLRTNYSKKIKKLHGTMNSLGGIIKYLKKLDQPIHNKARKYYVDCLEFLRQGDIIKYLKKLDQPIHNKAREHYVRCLESIGQDESFFTLPSEEVRTFIKAGLLACGVVYKDLKRYDKHQHRQHRICQELYEWISLTKTWISVRKRWTYHGLPPLKAFEMRPGFEKVQRYYLNLKKDAIKKIAQRIICNARKHGASIVLLEDLENFRMSFKYNKGKNALLSIWSPATIRYWCEHFAKQYGMRVVLIDPRDSSQLDPKPSEFGHEYGWRDKKFDKSKLYVLRDGKVITEDSDLAAARNLQCRFHTRYGDLNSIVAKPVVNALELGLEENLYLNEPGKRIESQLRRLYKSTHIGIIRGFGKVIKISAALASKIVVKNKPERFYRHGNRWCDWGQHKDEIEKIKYLVFPRQKQSENN